MHRQFAERQEEAEWLGAADPPRGPRAGTALPPRPGEAPGEPDEAGTRDAGTRDAGTRDAAGAPDPLHERGSNHEVTRTAPPPPSRVSPPTADR